MQTSPPPLSDATLPRKLGRYELVRLLGEDAVAETYLARPLGPNNRSRWLGFKLAHSQLANDEAFRRAFLQQARIGVALRHPNVVRTYEVAAEPGQCYAVTEFLRGRVLSRMTDDPSFRLPLELHLGLLLQVLEGLRYIHELGSKDGKSLGLVHRNLSPARVFVGYDGRVRILDTGLARVHAIASVRRDNPITVMRYSAPEQCLGRKVDARADLYAVGVMLWEAIAGQPRQFSKTLAESLDARVRNREPQLEQVLPSAPSMLARICQRALAWAPEERYAQAADMYRDLSCYVASLNRHVGQDALSRALHQQYASDIAAIEQLFDEEAPGQALRGTLTGMLPLPTSPNVVNAAQIHQSAAPPSAPPPSSIPPSAVRPSSVRPGSVHPHAVHPHAVHPHAVHPHAVHPHAVPPSAPPPSIVAGSGRKHWGFRTPGPSVVPIFPASAQRFGNMLRGRRLLSGVLAGSIAGLIIGLALRPLAHPDIEPSAAAEAPVVAPLLPHPDVEGASRAEAEAAPSAVAQPAAPVVVAAAPEPTTLQAAAAQPAAAQPAAAQPETQSEAMAAMAAALEPAGAQASAASAAAATSAAARSAPAAQPTAAPRFVVKSPEPLPIEEPRVDGPFVVKEPPLEEEALTESARRRAAAAAAKRRKRAAEAAEAAREAASRLPRPIDETDPYAEPEGSGRARERAR